MYRNAKKHKTTCTVSILLERVQEKTVHKNPISGPCLRQCWISSCRPTGISQSRCPTKCHRICNGVFRYSSCSRLSRYTVSRLQMNTSGWNVWFAQLADPFNFEPQQPDLWHDKPSLPFGRSICQSCLAKGSSFAKDELHTWCCLMHKFLYIIACPLWGWSSAPHELSALNYVFFRLSSLQCQAKSCPPSTQEKHRHRLRRRRPCPLRSNGWRCQGTDGATAATGSYRSPKRDAFWKKLTQEIERL